MRVNWSKIARSDLQRVLRYINQHNPAAAQVMSDRILRCAEQLSDFPMLGRETARTGYRLFAVTGTNYLIGYRVGSVAVEISAVIDGRSDRPEDIW